jgi:hypothetical protein
MTWGTSETEKVGRVIDRLVASHQQMVGSQRDAAAPVDRAVQDQEAAELRLLLNAVNAKDVIGLVSLCGVFWSTRNQLRREAATMQRQRATTQVVEALAEEVVRRCGAVGGRVSDEGLLLQHVNALRSQSFELLANYSLLLQQHYTMLYSRVYGGEVDGGRLMIEGRAEPAGLTSNRAHCVHLDDDSSLRLESIRQLARSALDADAARNDEIRQSLANMAACAAAQKGGVTRSAVEALAQAAQGEGGGVMAAAGAVTTVPASLPDGSVPWGLVRFVPAEAAVGETLLSVLRRCYGADDLTAAEQDPLSIFSINTGRPVVEVGRRTEGVSSAQGEQPLTSGTCIDSTFTRRCNVLVRVFHRITGLIGALGNIQKRLGEVQSTLLPAAVEAADAAREELWVAEIGRLQEASGLVLHASEAEAQAAAVCRAREKLTAAELRVHQLEEALRISTAHRAALERANVGALSSMLESRACELMAAQADPTSSLRLVYVCKELPSGLTLDSFASSFGVAKESLQVFEDHFADLSPVSKTRKRTVKTMVYVPTHVPRPALSSIDEELRAEIDAYQRQFPSFPPNAEIAEQLAAVRQCDVATLSTLLTNSRKRMQRFEETTELSALKRQVVDLQGALRDQRAKTEQLLASAKATEIELQAIEVDRNEERDALRDRCTEMQAKLEAAEKALQMERMSVKSTAAESTELRRQITDLELKIREAADQRHAILQELRDASQVSSEREAAVRRVQLLEAQTRTAEDLLAEERHSAQTVALLNAQLRSQISTLQQCIATLNEEAARLRCDVKRQADAAAQGAHELDRLHQELAAERDSHQQLTVQLQKAMGQLSTANANLASMRRDQQSQRETYIAKEIPAGRTAEEFAASLGVAADVAVPFFDPALGKHFLYFPVQTGRLSVGEEDRRLRQEIQAAQARSAAPTTGSSLGSLLDQLAALRSGDAVALSKIASDFRSKAATADATVTELQSQVRERTAELLFIKQQGSLTRSSIVATTATIDDEAEDLSWHSPEVGKKKIILFRERVHALERERDEWQHMCDEYRQRSVDFESLESAKADLLKRQAAQSLLADTASRELQSLTERLRVSEEGRVKDLEKFSAARRRLMDEQQAALAEAEGHLNAVKSRAASDLLAARAQMTHDTEMITRLTALLRQNGIAIESVEG